MASSKQEAPPLRFNYSISLLLLLLIASSLHGAAAVPTGVLCNHKTYGDDDPFGASLVQLLQQLVLLTPYEGNLYASLPHTGALAYGHAACLPRVQLPDDCEKCLRSAIKQILDTCGYNRIGAKAMLADCLVHYEQYAFID
ncbi:hypothetical protein HU200_040845 [Digitaria exilis]|uniref:Gnk2-homologous domain-containing protein n=1 Tax=Digitaria exilis TaxID=1010633 RepID=A0A835BIX4_9POAL|nr:hypothetical protein HU200_040845 [Digitaria exilis]CAB3452402.1 unnamed protein product [Digitaria exilis]